MNRFRYAAALAVIVGFSSPSFAQEAPKLTPAMVEQINLAAKLNDYGVARKDPLLLIAAARVLKSVTAESVAPQAGMSPDDILKKAKEFAAGRKDILELVEDVSKETSKGLCHGPGTKYGCF